MHTTDKQAIFARNAQIHQLRRLPSKFERKRDSAVVYHEQTARECIAVISRGRNSPSLAGGLFSRFYYRLIPSERSGGNNPSTGARLRPLVRRVLRRKPRKSLHERFGSLNPTKTADVVQRTRARYHLNAVAERPLYILFSSPASPARPRTRHLRSASPDARKKSLGPSPLLQIFSLLPGLFNLANFIRT